MFLTIIAALEATGLATKPTLNLHVIGATSLELRSGVMFEEIMHLLPTLSYLRVCFVGPETPQYTDVEDKPAMLATCPPCSNANRTRSLELYSGAYHDYVTAPNYEIPDLAVAFQTGHSMEEVESWAPTIRHLVRNAQHPTVFTAFNEAELVGRLLILFTIVSLGSSHLVVTFADLRVI
jgi:splicing suppressor protein 51